MSHDQNCSKHDHCACDQEKISSTRREFLFLAAGAIGAGVVGSSSVQAAAAGNAISVESGTTIVLPKHPDMHAHIRQGTSMSSFIECQLAAGNDILLAMPNTQPPVSRVSGSATEKSWSIESYLDMIRQAGGDKFRDVIVPLYLTKDTTTDMIDAGAKSGLLRAAKYYPPHGTTNSDFSVPFDNLIGSDIFRALEANNVVLCVHGEQHGIKPEEYFDRDKNAETIFYRKKMPKVIELHKNLRVSCEHLTTAEAVRFVKQTNENVVGTVTPQHLLYTVGDLLTGWDSDLYCKPLAKFESDREALLAAVTGKDNHKFIAGTDSAPHPRVAKSTPCGCAAGCFVGGIAPQLYAQAFENGGADLASLQNQNNFRRFMAENAWRFWDFSPSQETIRLVKTPSQVEMLTLPDGQDVAPLPLGMTGNCAARSATLPWSLEI